VALDPAWRNPSILMLLYNSSLERRKEGVGGYMEFNIKAPYSISGKYGAISGKLLILCHLLEL
jgi:hypothetical protein